MHSLDDWRYYMIDENSQQDVKDQLIEALSERIEKEKSNCKQMEERIVELNKLLEEKTNYEITRDIRYWKGIEKAYSDKLDEYFDKIVMLEKRNFLLECEIDELKEKLALVENV